MTGFQLTKMATLSSSFATEQAHTLWLQNGIMMQVGGFSLNFSSFFCFCELLGKFDVHVEEKVVAACLCIATAIISAQ